MIPGTKFGSLMLGILLTIVGIGALFDRELHYSSHWPINMGEYHALVGVGIILFGLPFIYTALKNIINGYKENRPTDTTSKEKEPTDRAFKDQEPDGSIKKRRSTYGATIRANRRYIELYLKVCLSFVFLMYVSGYDEATLLGAFCSISVYLLPAFIIIRLFLGEDIGLYSHQSRFSNKLDKETFVQRLEEFVKSSNGQIYRRSDNIIHIRFGNRYSPLKLFLSLEQRSRRKCFVIPCTVRAVMTEQSGNLEVTMLYEDDLSSGRPRDTLAEAHYRFYFKKIDKALQDYLNQEPEAEVSSAM